MSLLIDIRMPDWMRDEELRDLLAPHLPGVTIHCGPPENDLPDVQLLATNQMHAGVTPYLPNLQLVQKLGAGVETMLDDPNLPDGVRIARLEPAVQADEIAEYCLAEVLASLRDIRLYQRDQQAGRWQGNAPRRAADIKVAVLGLGHIGRAVSLILARNNFQVSGWSLSAKTITGVETHCGENGSSAALAGAEFVISVLPSTNATRGFANAALFKQMQIGAIFMNVGRGDLVNDLDLLSALMVGQLGGAVLDVFHVEPLPKDHPFWQHDKIVITPHVSGWSLGEGLLDVAENYRRLLSGQPLLREIDRSIGY